MSADPWKFNQLVHLVDLTAFSSLSKVESDPTGNS